MKKFFIGIVLLLSLWVSSVGAFTNGFITKQVYVGSNTFGGTVSEKGTVVLGVSSATTTWSFSNLTVISNVPSNYSLYSINTSSSPASNKAYSITRSYTITYTDVNTYTKKTTTSATQTFNTDRTRIW